MRRPHRSTAPTIASAALLSLAVGSVGCVSARTGTTVAWPASLGGVATEVVASSPVPADIRLGGHYGERVGRSGEETFHAGLDFAAPTGTEIFAVADGVVTHVARDDDHATRFAGYGNSIVVHHPALGVWTMYAHLSEVSVAVGDVVAPGTAMGRTGSTTNHRFRGMGAHLHFEVRRQRADGSDPFPGAYGRHNLDPEAWLASLGVVYGRHGVLETGRAPLAHADEAGAVEAGSGEDSAAEAGAWLVTRTAVATLAD